MTVDNLQLFKNFDIKKVYALLEFFRTTFYESYAKTTSDRHQADMVFASDFSKGFCDKALDHYVNFSLKHNVAPESVCPYKIISWYGYFLAQHTYFINKNLAVKIIAIAIACMQIILEKEGVTLERDFVKGVLRMVLLDISASKRPSCGILAQNTRMGMGPNGFYMVFKTASISHHK